MSSLKLSSSDFQPLPASEAVQQISRPSVSYWADAWRRLRENPRAMASLGLITFLLAFVSIGPGPLAGRSVSTRFGSDRHRPRR